MGNRCDAMMNQDQIVQQIERCRRLASQITDEEFRHSLEELAAQYEAQLPPRRDSFMLGRAAQSR